VTDEDSARRLLQRHVDGHGYLSWLGVEVQSVDDGAVTLAVPYDEKLTNATLGTEGDLHGGIAATLVDTAGGVACQTALDREEGGVATIDLNVSYLRRAADDLVATAEVVRAGTTVGVAEVSVESTTPDGEAATVAVGRGSYRLFRD
jgi:uncharacterized protein (TIGR00369 family)